MRDGSGREAGAEGTERSEPTNSPTAALNAADTPSIFHVYLGPKNAITIPKRAIKIKYGSLFYLFTEKLNKMTLQKTGILLLICLMASTVWAAMPKNWPQPAGAAPISSNGLRGGGSCPQGTSQVDQAINNVRARLLSCGDVWWDLTQGRYIVPKVEPGSGLPEVSALYAAAVWLGGKDPAGNLKLAGQTYRTSTKNDFWPGPLDSVSGTIEGQTCLDWDRHFVVTSKDINAHLKAYRQAKAAGLSYNCSLIPASVKGWPSKGNPYFFELNRFELPNNRQGLALFYDEDGDGLYNPCNGDYPVIDIRGCPATQYPDEMVFWIYNDNGGIHTQSQGSAPIQMEVQVQAFAYKSNDELNDMTFQRYKLINRATEEIDSCYFAIWVDPDLGCSVDDYIGCDTSRSLAICYNEDNVDGVSGCTCPGNVPSYCDEIPMIGIDYFRGPRNMDKPMMDSLGNIVLDENGNPIATDIGMSSFTYYVGGGGPGLPSVADPQTANEYYNLMKGLWGSGEPYTVGGNGYNTNGGQVTKYCFPGQPNDNNNWSMCSEQLSGVDARTIQSSGPFRLTPGAINELIIGVPIVFDQQYPCPSFRELQAADDIAQRLFDNCFPGSSGPDAPDVSWIELDREVIAVLTNDSLVSNNAYEGFVEKDLTAPIGEADSLYKFEGYKIFQFTGPGVGIADINNIEKARLVAQVDRRNGIATIYNWAASKIDGIDGTIYQPQLKVQGLDKGIQHTFRFTEDQFAAGNDRRLINHKKHYFTAVAYAYNGRTPVTNPNDITAENQRKAYLEGRQNIGDGENVYYTVIPRPIVDRKLNTTYGSGEVYVTRYEGVGNMGNNLDMTDDMYDKIMNGTFNGEISYKPGRAPISITIFNPLDVMNGEFELTLTADSSPNDTTVGNQANWILRHIGTDEDVLSDNSIESLNEQIITQYGFSVSVADVLDAGEDSFNNTTNGAIGSEIYYPNDGSTPWFNAITDGPNLLDFIRTAPNEVDYQLDPMQQLSTMSTAFVPYYLCRWDSFAPSTPAIYSPSWQTGTEMPANVRINNSLTRLNNVDVILTSDKSKWSRCVVVETSPYYLFGLNVPNGPVLQTEGEAKNFDVRMALSVGKDDANADGFPDPDGAIDPETGEPLRGMGWFPGYAIDVETGKRLNIFFGEASVFNTNNLSDYFDYYPQDVNIAHDMAWNPSATTNLNSTMADSIDINGIANLFFGGLQHVYVSNTAYDECAFILSRLNPLYSSSSVFKFLALRSITWTAFPLMLPDVSFKSYADGLIPSDMIVKLRVNNPYQYALAPSGFNTEVGFPSYKFNLTNVQALALDDEGINAALDTINIAPNPYFGYSPYETSQFTTTVKITNLPAKCKVTIYTIDGKFIKQYDRNEVGLPNNTSNAGVSTRQYTPDIEWDIKNSRGIPVASGVYLIHIDAGSLGQRTIKWFGVNRQFDPTGL